MHFPIIDKIAKPLPFNWLNQLNSVKILPVFYHLVGNEQSLTYARNLYHIPSEKEFEQDLDFLLRQYTPLDLKELIHYHRTGNLPSSQKYFFLSFDDGLRQCEEIIAPILLKKGVPATFFLNSAFIDNLNFIHRFKANVILEHIEKDATGKLMQLTGEYFDSPITTLSEVARQVMSLKFKDEHQLAELEKLLNIDAGEALKDKRPYMSKEQIRNLINNGFTLGAHGVQHPEFAGLTGEEQIYQAKQSIADVCDNFGLDYKVFAFPFTDYGVARSFFKRLQEEVSPDLTFGCAGLKKDMAANHIQRISLDEREQPAKDRLKSELLYYALKRMVNKNKIRRR